MILHYALNEYVNKNWDMVIGYAIFQEYSESYFLFP